MGRYQPSYRKDKDIRICDVYFFCKQGKLNSRRIEKHYNGLYEHLVLAHCVLARNPFVEGFACVLILSNRSVPSLFQNGQE